MFVFSVGKGTASHSFVQYPDVRLLPLALALSRPHNELIKIRYTAAYFPTAVLIFASAVLIFASAVLIFKNTAVIFASAVLIFASAVLIFASTVLIFASTVLIFASAVVIRKKTPPLRTKDHNLLFSQRNNPYCNLQKDSVVKVNFSDSSMLLFQYKYVNLGRYLIKHACKYYQ